MILEKMRSSLGKLELGFSTNGFISRLPNALGPNCPKLVFRAQRPNIKALGLEIFFMLSSKYVASNKLLFLNFGSFLIKYSQKIEKKPSKIFFLVPFQVCKFLLSLV